MSGEEMGTNDCTTEGRRESLNLSQSMSRNMTAILQLSSLFTGGDALTVLLGGGFERLENRNASGTASKEVNFSLNAKR